MSEIIDSWVANARHWVDALDNKELESRMLVTNQAVIDAVLHYHPAKVLDVGCGEGWLCRELQAAGIETAGVDGVPELIHQACMRGSGHFEVATFEELIQSPSWPAGYFDLVVFNFCLYEQQLTEQLLHQALRWVQKGGKVVIQTLHPMVAIVKGDPYDCGWRTETWAGLNRPFSHPYKWYFRTIGSWMDALHQAGWSNILLDEPLHPLTHRPASLLLKAEKQ